MSTNYQKMNRFDAFSLWKNRQESRLEHEETMSNWWKVELRDYAAANLRDYRVDNYKELANLAIDSLNKIGKINPTGNELIAAIEIISTYISEDSQINESVSNAYLQIYKNFNKDPERREFTILSGDRLFTMVLERGKPMMWKYHGKIDKSKYHINGELVKNPSIKMISIIQNKIKKSVNESYKEKFSSDWELQQEADLKWDEWMKREIIKMKINREIKNEEDLEDIAYYVFTLLLDREPRQDELVRVMDLLLDVLPFR